MSVRAEDLSDKEWLRSIWVLLQRVEQALLPLGTPPSVLVEPPDLGDIVSAVTSLQPGPTADEIARALAEVLRFPTPEPDANLARVADSLEKLGNQLKGVKQAGGGGGSLHVEKAANGTVTNPVAGTTELLGGNPARKGLMMWNLSNSSAYLKLGPNVTEDSWSLVLDPDGYWESPGLPSYTGPITALWVPPELEEVEGNMMITELTQ